MINTVYIKSSKAKKEFEQGNRTLSLKHRQLLIMVDGRRSNNDLVKVFGTAEVLQMLADLEKLGFLISPETASASELKSDIKTYSDESSLSQQHLVFIKTFLIEEAQLQLGLMSRLVEQKVDLVQNADDLKSCIAHWHMAIRDSRNGRTVADKLMERLAHLMANPPQLRVSGSAS